ncbi:hypothetical protein OROMI_014835 [Orobanche minor]
MDKSWIGLQKWDERVMVGMKKFMQFVKEHDNGSTLHYCPCNKCRCRSDMYRFEFDVLWEHLKKNGFWEKYTCWIYHGEESASLIPHDHGQYSSSNTFVDPTRNLIDDVFGYSRNRVPVENHDCYDVEPSHRVDRPVPINTAAIDKYNNHIHLQQTSLYPVCKMTILDSVMETMRLKVENRSSIKAVDDYLELTGNMLPEGHRLPNTHVKMRRILKDLGLSYIKIHVCGYDCVLYWGQPNEHLTRCPVCDTERYKLTPSGKEKAVKVLWYFPLKDRLERLFMSPHTAKAMRWHAEPRAHGGDTMIHPLDGEAWKNIDKEYPDFSSDVRNVRLGVASDGFNPFGNMSLSYTIWPVVAIPYNLPPWMCMKKEYNMLTLLVPGPGYPGKCIDIYLRPLIEELKSLWHHGHPTYDSYSQEMFYMHAICTGTISDFPAYGMLSRCVISGYRGCPVCLNAECARYHCRKIIRMRHRNMYGVWMLQHLTAR